MKTNVFVNNRGPAELSRNFLIEVTDSGTFEVHLAGTHGSKIDSACLLYIDAGGRLIVPIAVDPEVAEENQIQLNKKGQIEMVVY